MTIKISINESRIPNALNNTVQRDEGQGHGPTEFLSFSHEVIVLIAEHLDERDFAKLSALCVRVYKITRTVALQEKIFALETNKCINTVNSILSLPCDPSCLHVRNGHIEQRLRDLFTRANPVALEDFITYLKDSSEVRWVTADGKNALIFFCALSAADQEAIKGEIANCSPDQIINQIFMNTLSFRNAVDRVFARKLYTELQ